jgi:lipid II:glycine glycyltransferase (peptidoglycan interpeptide bridge formation enzyme)
MEIVDQKQWDQLVLKNAGHPLQLWGWGELKASSGSWTAHRLYWKGQGGAQILLRKLPYPFKYLAYIPRGPFFHRQQTCGKVVENLVRWAKKQGCVALKIESDRVDLAFAKGWQKSKNHILINKTALLDLSQSETELLAQMSKKTRQYVRKSQKNSISVRTVEKPRDIARCLAIYKRTAQRAGFALHDDAYYYDLAKILQRHSVNYLPERAGEALAFLWLVQTPAVSFELYGGMSELGQQLRANYVLKWRAIQDQQQRGVRCYDMNGLLSDGISTFKLGFSGGQETYLAPSMDKPLSVWYPIWGKILPVGKRLWHFVKRK